MALDSETLKDKLLGFLGFHSTPFEFMVNQPIEVCIQRLQKLHDPHGSLGPFMYARIDSTEVKILPKNGNFYPFRIQRRETYGPMLTVLGQMESPWDHSTIVKGSVRPYWTMFVTFVVIGFGVLGLSSTSSNMPPSWILLLFVFIIGGVLFFNVSVSKVAFIGSIRRGLSDADEAEAESRISGVGDRNKTL